jgi:hypothetical protein
MFDFSLDPASAFPELFEAAVKGRGKILPTDRVTVCLLVEKGWFVQGELKPRPALLLVANFESGLSRIAHHLRFATTQHVL